MKRIATLFAAASLLGACKSTPQRIDPESDAAVTSMGVDYAEIVEWSEELTRRMLESGFLDSNEFGEHPVRMVVSDVENKTDLVQFPKEMMLARIRSALLRSGKVRLVSTYGTDATDEMTRDTQELANDPLFDASQVPAEGQASVARLSLRAQILWSHSSSGRAKQNTYEVRMFVTDVRTGEVVWEDVSDPIAKKKTRSRFGL